MICGEPIICGVDVSASVLDARIGLAGPHARFARDAQGIAGLAAFCRRHAVALVALEASGGYEKLPFALLWQEQVPCALANPRSVRRFAEALGRLEKTDKIDAGVIAHYAAACRLAPRRPPEAAAERLSALTLRLRQLTEMTVAVRNQRRLVEDAAVLADIDGQLAELAARRRAFEQAIAAMIDSHPLWARLAASFRQIKGVAERAISGLLAFLPEIGTLSGKAIAKLAGLAPIAHDSGKRSGRRPVRGGRANVRALLVIVASVVARHHPDFAAFHHRLLMAGKPKMVARVALAHKLLTRLNAKARQARAAMPHPT